MIILGSSSPRRIELLKTLTNDFKILKPDFDESSITAPSEIYSLEEAKCKYFSLKNLANPKDFIITCDTSVVLGAEIFGKPKDEKDAERMLKMLSGRTHKVITGVTVLTAAKTRTFSVTSEVTFDNLEDEEIKYYIDAFHPYDKAGAYGVQEWIGYVGVAEVRGSYYNVMGLPTQRLYQVLKHF